MLLVKKHWSRLRDFIRPSGSLKYIVLVFGYLKAHAGLIGGLLLGAALCQLGLGQQSGVQVTPNPEDTQLIAQAVRVDRAPRLDGSLDDPLWQLALPITDFRQREPYEGHPSTERTEVRVIYTHNEVYFGIVCHDSDATGPVATQLRRDVTQELDDYFEIVIDSRHDRRNAYVFQINPLGTQRDALITDEQSGEIQDGDPGWDGVWTSEARIDMGGWTATVAIPFATLNFMRSQDVVWGINFKRFIRRKNEEDLWSAWRRTFGANKISEAGELHGITNIGSGRLFIIKPYGLVGFNHLPPNATESGLKPGTTALHTGGVDIKIGLRSNLVANLTGNTDFADRDVDVQQFNLTPYKLYFPEKRQFFLENAGVFAFPMSIGETGDQLFFSRQIGIDPVTGQQVPINGGGKVTGSLEGFEIGAMDVETRSSGPNPWANFAVLRVKRSLWGTGSYLGVMGIDKRSGEIGSSYNQTSGMLGCANARGDFHSPYRRDELLHTTGTPACPTMHLPGRTGNRSDGNIVLHFPQARLLTVFGLEDSVVYFCAALRLL